MHGESVVPALFNLIARNRRRYGGYIVHVGILLMFIAFTGMAFRVDQEATLKPGESVEMQSPYGGTYKLTHLGVSQYNALNRVVSAATVQVDYDGKSLGVMKSEKRQHVDSRGNPSFEPSTEVGILESLRQDVYLVLHGVTGEETAEIRITFNPLVWWVWYGGIIMAIGGLIVMWPQATRAGTKRRAEGGYVVVMQPSERPHVEAGV